MNCLFVMDPIERINPEKDTTYLLIKETLRRGWQAFYCDHRRLHFKGGAVFATCSEILQMEPDIKISPPSLRPTSDFPVIWMRSDPPFDLDYLAATHLLALAMKDSLVLNDPHALQRSNEKLYALNFYREFCPETLVSADPAVIREFLTSCGGQAILKPLYYAGGSSIFMLKQGDPNLNVILETSTHEGRQAVLVQRYLPEVKKGDKRLIVLDGEPVGAVLRVSQSEDHRSNIHLGGACLKAAISERDREICGHIKSRLISDGLFLVGLDIIGPYVTEINVTSPTGFQEINRLNGLTGEQTLQALTLNRLQQKMKAKK